MNREEAIVMWVIPALKNTWNEKRCNEILDALEQEPVFFPPCQDCNTKMDEIRRAYDKLQKQEPCDAVSKEAVLNGIFEDEYIKDHINGDVWERIEGIVDELPSVTPAGKVGQWVFVKGYEGLLYECTVCKNKNTHTTVRWNYCPHCGVKMQEVEE